MTKLNLALIVAASLLASASLCSAITPLPYIVPAAVADVQDFQTPDHVQLRGWIGARMNGSESNRLIKVDTDRLLEGYRKRPGRQSWDGEHVGKWLHAATLAWVNTGDPALRAKLDYTAAELCKCQLADGYLGTYLDKDRWTEWDVWAHKYNLIGLLTYVQYTGNEAPMPVCRRMADLLCNTFGDTPGKKDIIPAGEHVGMAPTSVLEPMVLLYRMTGEKRYLDFCQYILRSWEQDDGPHLISTLLKLKRVDKVGDAKAYEMLSCLNGALEYHRAIGDKPEILAACLNAWQDIVKNRLYLTGTASSYEVFHDDFDLPNTNDVGETCVTVTWLQFNAQLLRLTGQARFSEQLERVVLNQLFGAQQPDCSAWGYYVQMEGKKPYATSLDGNCCLSSGPRGVALIPTFAESTDADGVVLNLYEAGQASLKLRDGNAVTLVTETQFPADEHIRVTVKPAASEEFAIKVRLPEWCKNSAISVAGRKVNQSPGPDGYVAVKRVWSAGDQLDMYFPMAVRVITGDHLNAGKAAVMYGPLVLAADDDLLAGSGLNVDSIALPSSDLASFFAKPEAATKAFRTWSGARVFCIRAVADKATATFGYGMAKSVCLLPFADAGGTGARYRVWLPVHRPVE